MSMWWFNSQRVLIFFLGVPFFFHRLVLFGVVWFCKQIPLGPDIPGILLLYALLYTLHVCIHPECCCRCCCCSVPVLLLQQLLLFVIVCRMAKIVDGSLNLIPYSVFFLFIQTRFFLDICTLWQGCRIYGLDLPILHPR